MTFIKNRQCQHCHTLFIPDHRNGKRQKFCPLPECKLASKAASQKRWLVNNPGYFKGTEHVQRVQEWRRANPGYRKGKAKGRVLQDDYPPESPQKQEDVMQPPPVGKGTASVLQDILITQHPVFIGLIAQFTGLVLQDDIAAAALRLAQLGQDVLNGSTPTQGGHNDPQVPNLSRPRSNHPRAVQLAGSPSGP